MDKNNMSNGNDTNNVNSTSIPRRSRRSISNLTLQESLVSEREALNSKKRDFQIEMDKIDNQISLINRVLDSVDITEEVEQ